MTDKNYYGMTPNYNKGIHNNDCKNVKVQERTISTIVGRQIMPRFVPHCGRPFLSV